MIDWSFFHAETGLFAPSVVGLPEGVGPDVYAPMGCVPYRGRVDRHRVCIDLATGNLVPYQPPAPAADEWQTWTWDEAAWRWVSVPTDEALVRDARAERGRRLAACDWTQLPDVPAGTAQAWATYRQALRDITEQPGFPTTITWPEEPTP